MFKNYFTIAFRHFKHNKVFSLINIAVDILCNQVQACTILTILTSRPAIETRFIR